MGLPRNGDAVIEKCLNCDASFAEVQKVGEWIKCDDDDGGCGFEFRLMARTRKLETSE